MTARVRPAPARPAGTVVRLAHRSRVLADNPWGDPAERELPVYLPPGYRDDGPPHLALWDFAAFTNAGPGHVNWRNHGENLPQRLDRLIAEGRLPPVVVPMPDAYTSLGGNQYIDSDAVGRYATWVVEELVPAVDARFNVVASRDGRGVFGKSSGGYGALVHAMRFPRTWGAAASHAGDVGFEWVYRTGFPGACQVLSAFGGDVRAFLEAFWRKERPAGVDFGALLTVAMAASYDPDPEAPLGFALPFDSDTCTVDEARWARWLEHDPLTLLETHAGALASLHGLWVDCGSRDQYHIQYGTRRLARRLVELGVPHHHEEFDGTHSGIDWRLDHSLPYLADALAEACGTDHIATKATT